MATEPLAEPATVGANCTLTEVLWFGESVRAEPPLAMLKPAPVTFMPEIDTFELPVLVTLKLCVAVEPLFTEPKLRLAGLTLSVEVAATPVPLSETVEGEFGELLTIVTEPLPVPAAVGAY